MNGEPVFAPEAMKQNTPKEVFTKILFSGKRVAKWCVL